MSTRGLYGIRKKGIDKCTYNYSDSYPSWLGKKILEFCANNSVEKLNKFFDCIELVSEDEKPTSEQMKQCQNYCDGTIADDWYRLLRNIQGNFNTYQKLIDADAKIFMTDGISFIKDSLFCEYAYIINLDDEVLEFYKGFQEKPQKGNRYGETDEDGYYPCQLIFSIPFHEITNENINSIVRIMETGFESLKDVEKFEKLQKEFGLSEMDARVLVENDLEIDEVYLDTYEVGHKIAIDYFCIPDSLDNDRYINFELIGEDDVNFSDEWFSLPSGKYAHLK